MGSFPRVHTYAHALVHGRAHTASYTHMCTRTHTYTQVHTSSVREAADECRTLLRLCVVVECVPVKVIHRLGPWTRTVVPVTTGTGRAG